MNETPEDKPARRRGGLLRSSAVTGGMTLVSRVLGLARDVVLARMFGPGDGTDAFFLAFKIPNFLRRLFAEGAFNQAFIPVLSEYRSQRSLAEVQTLINRFALADLFGCDYAGKVLPKPNGKVVVVPDQGHFVLWNRPELVTREILDVLDRTAAP